MAIYEFHFFDAADRRPYIDFFDGETDAAAVHAAVKGLEQHASCVGVDIRQGDQLVARMTRPKADTV